jgi:hypothetical protein
MRFLWCGVFRKAHSPQQRPEQHHLGHQHTNPHVSHDGPALYWDHGELKEVLGVELREELGREGEDVREVGEERGIV